MKASHNYLPWIVAFKAFKTLTLIALGVILLATRHKDSLNVLMRVALSVHLPLTSRVFERAFRFAMNLTVAKETALAVSAFGYAALLGTEGVGLYLRRPWSRWLTIAATGSLIPIEIYEVLRELHLLRVLILAANVAIVVYLARRRELFERA